MAKATQTQNEKSKSELVREYKAAHPTATVEEIVKALTKHGVTKPDVYSASRSKNGSTRVDVETIKLAGAFVKQHGNIKKALEAIENVGAFIDECGSSSKAKAALESYEALKSSM